MKRLTDSSDVPEARRGILLKNMYKHSRLRQQKSRMKGEFVVASGASMHMVSKRDLNSAELETMRTSRSPTTVMTANCEVQTREEATVYVEQLD